jgi:hypothetical protein
VEERKKDKRAMNEEVKKIEVIRGKTYRRKGEKIYCSLCRVFSSFVKIDQFNQTAKGRQHHDSTRLVPFVTKSGLQTVFCVSVFI